MKETGRFLKKYRGIECLNCGVPLDTIDRYCHHCGQINTTKKLSFKDFFNEFFASIFSYDSRLRHTIIALLFRPGKISKDYIKGRRVRYANPFRFYLSISVIFFIINGLFIDFDGISDGLKKEEKAINFNTLSEGNYTEKDTITLPTNTTKSKKTKNRVPYTESQLDSMNLFSALGHKLTIYNTHYISTKQISPNIALDSLKHKKTWYNKYLYKRSIKASNFGSNPTELIEFIFSKLPFIIFFFLPIFTLCMWALYSRQSFSYMEHMVFIFHIQTIFFILMGIAISIKEITKSEIINGITTLFFLFYLYKAMRKFYEQKRGKTIVKFVLVNILFFILAGIGSTLTLIGSMFIF